MCQAAIAKPLLAAGLSHNTINKMTKPIFLVGLPQMVSFEQIEEVQKNLEQKLEQYYPLVYMTNSGEIDFKCFFEKDFDEVKFDELKQIVRDAVK